MKVYTPDVPDDDAPVLRIDPDQPAVLFDPWPFKSSEVKICTRYYALTTGINTSPDGLVVLSRQFNVMCSLTNGELCVATKEAFKKATGVTL